MINKKEGALKNSKSLIQSKMMSRTPFKDIELATFLTWGHFHKNEKQNVN